MNLSFAGCGFLGIYHVGVAVCFKKYAPHLLLDKISGASAGCLAATCLLCDMPLGEMTSDFFRVVNEARSHSLGPFSPSFNIQTCLLEGLQKFLPPDAHKRVNGRLHVSLTRSCDGKNIIVSQFDSREDLLQALLCACFIPGFSGILPPRFQGVRYMDGAFSDNLPVLDENTVTVSPFCGESDICPRDQSAQLFHVNWANTSIELSRQNINRFIRILFPPKPEVLSNMCQQGFDDALQFLHRNNLISCTRCLAVQSTFVVQEAIPDAQDYDPECTECQQHRKDALIGDMPETVLTVFQTYIESANKGLANWMFRHKGTKILQALSLPATLPADFVCATLTKLVAAAPCIREQFWSLSKYVLSQLNAILKARGHQKMSGSLSCQLPIDLASKQKSKHILSHRSSKIDVFHNNQDGTPNIPAKEHIDSSNNGNSEFNPAYSFELTANPTQCEVDTFDHILQVTSHHEAVYAYYYMDDNNKVKFTKIFDLTDSNTAGSKVHSDGDSEQQMMFESEWDAMPTTDCTHDGKKHHHVHSHAAYSGSSNNNNNNNNNNTINVNNNQKPKRQYSIGGGTAISEDDLDNLINQSINEWQQRQQSNSELDKSTIDVDVTQSAPFIS